LPLFALCLLAVPAMAFGSISGLPLPSPLDVLPAPGPDPTVNAKHDTEPVILNGSSFPDWSVPANQTAKAPATDLSFNCPTGGSDSCKHNHYEKPEVDTADHQDQMPDQIKEGTDTTRLLGYRWDEAAGKFVQIPFQVDEVFTRYLDNQASGFAIYSGEDQHTTYAYEREGYRFTANDPNDPCKAVPAVNPADSHPQPGGPRTTPDPVKGLDSNDELVFMANDAGPQAPLGAGLPKGIEAAHAVAMTDPQTGEQTYAYVMKASDGGPAAAYSAANGYVRWDRDANADTFHFSESNNDPYGQAPKGPYCDKDGNLVRDANGNPKIAQRRPGDEGTISTPRYRFRYDGRWLMTDIRISPDGDGNYGPDLVDRWKARAFAQDPGSETPCCGFEDEDVNWGGSSQLLGELKGPVRAIRETWGADSGTNVIRRESFYRDEVRQKTWLRVHVIPPLDGIYAQWDFNAGKVAKYYNDRTPQGVDIDGKNDEVIGNLDDPCNSRFDAANNPNNTSAIDQQVRGAYKQAQLCNAPYHQSVDITDPTLGDANAALGWNETSGPYGTIVDRYQLDKVTDATPGGTPQSLMAMPYYRDDSCFDDGTGSDPGPRLRPGEASETSTYNGVSRKCWDSGSASEPAEPNGDPRYYQGDIGAHGLHLLFQVDSDNGRQTVPLDEIVAENRMVMLAGERDARAGEEYGRGTEKPLVTTAGNPTDALLNPAPTAAFDYSPPAPGVGQTVSFDASASTANDNAAFSRAPKPLPVSDGITKYEWDLDGNGSYETDTDTTATTSHVYSQGGAYPVGLRVTDKAGGTDVVTNQVTVTAPPNQSPTAAFSFSPPAPTTDDEVSFNGTSSSDSDGSIAKYEWDLDGNGSYETDTGTTATTSHTYAEAGTYPVGLRVTDDDGATDEVSHDVTVTSPPPPNQVPTAAFNFSPTEPTTDDQVSFNGSGSSDSDGSVAKYEWDLDGDGTYETDTGTTATTSHTYGEEGTYPVGLRVTDDDGATDEVSHDVTVTTPPPPPNQAPTAAFEYSPSSPAAGEAVSFDGSGSSDSDGSVARYEWDFDGDGTYETDAGTAATTSHTYAEAGTYPVGLRVTDDDGATDEVSHDVTVTTPPPPPNVGPAAAFDFSPAAPTTDDQVGFDGSGSSDVDGTVAKYEWDLDGNGSYETDTGTTATTSHTYSEAGTYPVGLRVTDDDGATDEVSHDVTVTTPPPPPNQAPTAAFEYSPSSPAIGEEVGFDGSGSSDSDGNVAGYEWDFDGDGTYETDTGTTATTSHTFDQAGTYQVGLRVTDDDGATATTSTDVDVVAPQTVPAFDFSLELAGNRGTLAYTANEPVTGAITLRLLGSRNHRWQTIVKRVSTSQATGSVQLSRRIQALGRKCRDYRHCKLIADALVSDQGQTLFRQRASRTLK
jgi:PKD repeat protein